MKTLTGVGWHLSAAHKDRLTGALHGHTWEVVAWHECKDANDAVVLQNHLKTLLSVWDHGTLPDELASGEAIAEAVLNLSPPSCVEVVVSRPPERIYAKAMA